MEGSMMPKQTYRPSNKLEVFFTGGVARITRDSKLLACCSGEEVKVVDVATGAVVRTLAGDTEPVTALAVSPDNKTLVMASRSLMCRVYNMTTGDLLRTWRPHKSPVADLAIDASGGYVATASADRMIKVWDLQGGFCTHSFTGHSGVVLRVLFHPKQLQLFSGGDDAEVRVWDLVEKKCVAELKSHFSAVTSLALSSDGWVLLSGGRDKVVCAWDLRTYAKLATVPVFETVEGVVNLPVGSPFPGIPAANDATIISKKGTAKPLFFATAGSKGQIRIWRTDTASCVYEDAGLTGSAVPGQAAPAELGGGASQEYTDLLVVPGGHALMATTADARLIFYHVDQDKQRLSVSKQLIGNVDEVTDLRFVGGTPAAPTHIAVATNCEVIQLFHLEDMSCTASCLGHKETVLCLDAAFGAGPLGSGLMVSGAKDNEVRVWEVPAGRCLGVGVGHVGSVSAVALASKQPGKFMVSAGADKLLKVWDVAGVLEAAANPAQEEAPPSKKLKAAGGGAAAAGLLAGGVAQMRVLAATSAHDKDINSLAVAPNDSLVATGSQDRTARVWKLPSLTPHLVLRGHKRGVWSVEFSPVDQVLLTSSGDKTIKMWSLAEGGQCIRTFEGHQASVLRCCFITMGTQVLSAGADGLVKLWSLKSDECLSTFDEHQGKIWAMSTGGQDQALLATGGSDACVCIWSDVTASDAEAAQEAAEQLLGKEQDLANALADNDFSTAAKLAFELRHPGRLLAVVQRAAAASAVAQPLLLGATSQAVVAGQTTHALLANLVRHMSDDDVKVALEYCREWNTNSKHCHAAQSMLNALLRHKKPSQLTALPGAGEVIDGLLAYSSRHFSRVDRLLRSTHLLDYTLAAMKVFGPDEEMQEEEERSAVQVQPPQVQPQRRAARKQAASKAVGNGNGVHHPGVNGVGSSSSDHDSESDHGMQEGGSDASGGSASEEEAGSGDEAGHQGGGQGEEEDDFVLDSSLASEDEEEGSEGSDDDASDEEGSFLSASVSEEEEMPQKKGKGKAAVAPKVQPKAPAGKKGAAGVVSKVPVTAAGKGAKQHVAGKSPALGQPATTVKKGRQAGKGSVLARGK